jgi:RHS repeat-associated protein
MRSIDGGVRFSVWDDWELLEEYDADNARTAAYLQGAHGVIKSLLNNIYYYQDKLGSTTHIADANGTLESYHYDLYGTPAETSTHNIVDLYAGERWLPELGLYDLRNRFMSPELGRFLQADPVGFKGDASNLYRYCHNDSVDFSDPTGLVDEWKKQMLWQGGGDGSVSEQLKRLDEAAGIQSPPTNGHVRIEEARIVDATVDRTRYDSQRANVADDEHFADRGGAIADGQPPGLTSGHSFASDNATVRPVVFTQYGRYFDAGGGVLKPYGKQWSDVAKAGEPEHQREIAADMSRANLQARADKAFARGGVPELRKEMNKAMSNAVQKSGWAHDNPINGNHHLYKPQQMRWPYTKEALPYDQ